MKNNIKVICAFILGIMVGGATVVCANEAIQAILNQNVKIVLNGEVQEFHDAKTNERQYPITYKDRTYLPLRNIAELVGISVDYVAEENIVELFRNDPIANKIQGQVGNKKVYPFDVDVDGTPDFYCVYDDVEDLTTMYDSKGNEYASHNHSNFIQANDGVYEVTRQHTFRYGEKTEYDEVNMWKYKSYDETEKVFDYFIKKDGADTIHYWFDGVLNKDEFANKIDIFNKEHNVVRAIHTIDKIFDMKAYAIPF